ncbi:MULTISPECIES: adenylate/guanylate cyclase domain-containing protein [unclassified Corynebacterium]|uniref:adenylate/guanylate cyclase domain-containing protein n=1 Tax=unclassified Corynebacterium TaxID=2624378 RepID=UPI0035238E93
MSRVAQIIRWLWGTSWPLYAATVLGSNVLGAVGVMLFLKFLVPLPATSEVTHRAEYLPVLAVGYLLFAIVVGVIATAALFLPVLRWQRHPEAHDPNMVRNLVMRIPVYQSALAGAVWMIGIGIITTVAGVEESPRHALVVGLTSFLGGSVIVLLTYLEAARLVRPVAVIALARRFEDSTLEPPVQRRLQLTWLSTTGIPAIGILLLIAGQKSGYFTADPEDILPAVIALALAALVTGFAATALVIMSVVDPIRELQDAINKVRRGETSTQVDIYDGSEIGVLQAGFNEMMRGLRERQRVRELFGRYVGTEVAHRAMEERPTLGGEDRKVAVLFVDVIGSTGFAVNHTPEEVVAALNQFFEHVVDVVHRHKGIINKFQGDAALAVFGAPLQLADATGHALAAARELRQELKGMELSCGIGVSAGHVVAGHIGGHDRFEYTVIGDAVNQAARLTELAKNTPGQVLTSAATLRDANEAERARWTLLKSVELRGRHELTQLARPIRATLAERA